MPLGDFVPYPEAALNVAPEKGELKEAVRAAERVRGERKEQEGRKGFEKFGKQYHSDPVAFVHDCFFWERGAGLTPYQEEILAAIPTKEQVAVVGCHGLGKTFALSMAILWFSLTREALRQDWKAPVTASGGGQLFRYTWPEVRKWAKALNWRHVGRVPFNTRNELLMYSLQLEFGQAFTCAPETPEKIEGAHADQLFFGFDESKEIPQGIWDAASGAFSGAGPGTGRQAFGLAISTPGGPSGYFYDIHRKKEGLEYWHTRHVRVEEVIAANRTTQEFVDRKGREWGRDSSVFRQRILGEFASDDSDALIPLEWITAAIARGKSERESGDPLPRDGD